MARVVTEVRGFWSPDVIVVDAAEGEAPRRQLMGTVLPFSSKPGENVGYTSIGPTRFLAGSIDPAARPPVDRDHDSTRLIGKVVDAEADDKALIATVRLSQTPLGDETLALAADEVATGFSVTARPLEYSFEDDDDHGQVLVVAKADWVRLAVTPDPAFQSAQISQVAASRDDKPNNKESVMDLSTLVDLLVAASEERRNELIGTHSQVLADNGVSASDVRLLVAARTPVELVSMVPVSELVSVAASLNEEDAPAYRDQNLEAIEAGGLSVAQFDQMVSTERERRTPPPQPVQINAGSQARTRPRGRADFARWLELAAAASGAYGGDRTADVAELEAMNRDLQIEAALTGVTTTTVAGIVPPTYTVEVLNGLDAVTPLTDFAVRRNDLPMTGMSIIKPAWTTKPEGGFYTTENTQPATGAANIGTRTVPVLNWAHAVLASLNTLERSSFGGFAQHYYEQALISYQSDLEALIATDMLAAVVAGPGLTDVSGSTTIKAKIAALVSAQIGQQLDANGVFRGLRPNFAAVATDVYETLAGTDTDAGLAFGSGTAEIGGLVGSLGTLQVLLAPNLDAGGIIVGSSMATELREGSNMQLRQVVVNTLSVELGVHVNLALDVEYATALAANNDAFS